MLRNDHANEITWNTVRNGTLEVTVENHGKRDAVRGTTSIRAR